MHQVCDTTTGKCQACTETNTQHCLQSDICLDGKCSPKCPQSCTVDNDCAQCGGPGNEAHACFAHKCAECSDTYPCAASTGMECVNGVCTPPCGLPGPEAGTCITNEDCTFCGDPNEIWECKIPVNGGNHGTCMPPAEGCEDLGTNVAVLPPPYDAYTNLCSNDGNCSGIGIQYNVGKAIRDMIGSNEVMGITIHDANILYAMPICAEVQITENIDCGICVPCEEDADCLPIDIDPLIVDLFASDPLAMIAGALLIDMLWGNNEDHDLNFFCQPVAAGYGACIPCGNPLQPCGTGGGGGGTGTCDHDVCTIGTALNGTCGPCASTVCTADAFCCDAQNGSWDQLCIDQADSLCGNICSGGGGCAHGPCATGDALVASCSPCVGAICANDPFCCNQNGGSWDQYCVDAVATTTECSTENCGGGSTCVHSPCVAGGMLTPGCDGGDCVTNVCNNDSFCCDTEWDSICVSAAESETACSCP
ncbi:MAG: hypothetical protein DRI90_16820 [Deltaproteobacteria bacterium]|nr:MAG: hypothetical protein DRI90_16820 [Deltaproteobacteria bacterium]